MAESPDLAALARRYVDLWQDQLTAMAADPALAESTARLLAALVPAGWPPQPRQDDDAGTISPGSRRSAAPEAHSSAAGAAAAGAASDQRDRRMAQLARRLAALEKRLAAVEAGIRPPRRNAQPRPRRRKK
ncbi:MAG TPA: hypothetical protein VNF99_15395 [Stellaceae bacterium]|nr:hypothetical protein [Stellaceae bacterium]